MDSFSPANSSPGRVESDSTGLLFPRPNGTLLVVSLLVSFGGFLILPYIEVRSNVIPGTRLDFISYYLDPVLLNLFGGLPLLWFCYVMFRNSLSYSPKKSALWALGSSFLLGAMIVFGEYYLETHFLKDSFGLDRPTEQLRHPWLIQLFINLGWYVEEEGRSAPSGFTMRQILLALSYLFAITGTRITMSSSQKLLTNILSFLSVALVVVIAYFRVYRGAHTLYDIGMALGIGIVLFWVAAEVVSLMLELKWEEEFRLLIQLSAASSLLGWLFYARETDKVMSLFLAASITVAVLGWSSPYTGKLFFKFVQFLKGKAS